MFSCSFECGDSQLPHLLSKLFISLYLHLDFVMHPRDLMDALLPTTLGQELVEFDKCLFGDESTCALQQGVECRVRASAMQLATVQSNQITPCGGCLLDLFDQLSKCGETCEEFLFENSPCLCPLADDAADFFVTGSIQKRIVVFRWGRYAPPRLIQAARRCRRVQTISSPSLLRGCALPPPIACGVLPFGIVVAPFPFGTWLRIAHEGCSLSSHSFNRGVSPKSSH